MSKKPKFDKLIVQLSSERRRKKVIQLIAGLTKMNTENILGTAKMSQHRKVKIR